MLSVLGLLIIAVAWFYQFMSIKPKHKGLEKTFLVGYITGVILLVIDGLNSHLEILAALNGACLLTAAGTLWKMTSGK
ncbi:hypothetical protein M1116_03635 [Patescibacteria group bacterium]|nr:hypothetical protein [Patescibacteria group bacterium]